MLHARILAACNAAAEAVTRQTGDQWVYSFKDHAFQVTTSFNFARLVPAFQSYIYVLFNKNFAGIREQQATPPESVDVDMAEDHLDAAMRALATGSGADDRDELEAARAALCRLVRCYERPRDMIDLKQMHSKVQLALSMIDSANDSAVLFVDKGLSPERIGRMLQLQQMLFELRHRLEIHIHEREAYLQRVLLKHRPAEMEEVQWPKFGQLVAEILEVAFELALPIAKQAVEPRTVKQAEDQHMQRSRDRMIEYWRGYATVHIPDGDAFDQWLTEQVGVAMKS